MDPEIALTKLRNAIRKAQQRQTDDTAYPLACVVENSIVADVVESFEALDGWLRAGGFKPADWR